MHAQTRRISCFSRREHGSISVLFGLLSFVLFATIGAAVDYNRWHSANQKIESVVDSALLAGGRQYQTDPSSPEEAVAAAQTYFNQAVAGGIDVQAAQANFAIVQAPMGLTGNATGRVTTPFLGMMNIANLPVNHTAQVEFGVAGGGGGAGNSTIEVSMMLDVTESMCDGGVGPCASSTKMDALKSAAKDLVSIVTASNISQTVARVALVPFSGAIRVDDETSPNAPALMKSLTDLDSKWTGWHKDCQNWSGGTAATSSETSGSGWTCDSWLVTHQNNLKIIPCVTDRTGPEEFTDAAPGPNAWLLGMEGTRATVSWDSSDTALTSETGQTNADPSYAWNYSQLGQCWNIEAPNYVMPLTGDKTALNQRIDALSAYGPTGGALGTAWAWYMLSPNWSGVWTGQSTPGAYSDLVAATSGGIPKLRKIVVLMTDGDYNTYRGWSGQDPVMVADHAKQICANMKAQGVEVFTVGFDLDSLPAAEKSRAIDTLQTCGTDIEHFYNSLDPAQLKTSFRDIALKLSQLYLSK